MIDVRIDGLDAVMRRFTLAGIAAQGTADRVTETYARKMANEAAALAPVDSGDMRTNIVASPHRLAPAAWEFGGTLPYTRKQEYEHRTHKGFIRKAVWDNEAAYIEAIRRQVMSL